MIGSAVASMTGGSGQIRWTAEGTVLPACKVVDASLFPVVPCANTNFPTLMTAERIADATLAAA
jgi:TRAP-type mannitol/chloroaromatic compound transport system substrate-binding protein